MKRANAKLDAVAQRVEAFEVKKFPRRKGKPVADSPDAIKLPGNLYS